MQQRNIPAPAGTKAWGRCLHAAPLAPACRCKAERREDPSSLLPQTQVFLTQLRAAARCRAEKSCTCTEGKGSPSKRTGWRAAEAAQLLRNVLRALSEQSCARGGGRKWDLNRRVLAWLLPNLQRVVLLGHGIRGEEMPWRGSALPCAM